MVWLSKLWLKLTKPAELVSWLGTGATAVPQFESNRRARICETCPANQTGSRLVETPIGILKSRLGLKVLNEERLHTCQACGCFIAAKVHVPYDHLKAWQRTPELKKCKEANLDCWQI